MIQSILKQTKKHRYLLAPIVAMFCITTSSNFLVEIPINQWLTWGAFTYPFSFLVTELTNYYYGPRPARTVVYAGFCFAIVVTFSLMNQRIALAGSTAFLVAQLLDIAVFNKLRRGAWWLAPWTASVSASFIDTAIFFSVAFIGEDIPWVTLAIGDFAVKLIMDLCLLLPFRIAIWRKRSNVYT
jgi:uncharacterized PurR-regulated membrane protein YhhQ (DUF165 family)